MIKGVNKRIIEIINPNDEYFEKVVIFLSPKVDKNLQVINSRALEYVDNLCVKKRKRKPKPVFLSIAKILLPAVVGSVLTTVILLI